MSPPWSPCPVSSAAQASNPPGMLWQLAASNALDPKWPISDETGDLERRRGFISGPVSPARRPTKTWRGCAGEGELGSPGACGADAVHLRAVPRGAASAGCGAPRSPAGAGAAPESSTSPAGASEAASPSSSGSSSECSRPAGPGSRQGWDRGGLGLNCHLRPAGPSAGSTGRCSTCGRCSRTRPPASSAWRWWRSGPATTPWSVPPAPAPGSTAAASR